MQAELTLETVRDAAARIRGHVVRTPVLEHVLARRATLLLKPEGLQPTGRSSCAARST